MDNVNADEKNGKWKHLVKYCLDLYKEFNASDYRASTIKDIKESIEAYDQVEKKTNDPWPGASNITLPLTTISNDNLAPRLSAGLVGKQPYIKLEMENDQEKDTQTEIVQTWYNQELEDVVGVEGLGIDIIEKVLKEGTVFPMPRYDLDEEVKKDFLFANDKITQEQDASLVARQEAGEKIEEVGGVFVNDEGPIIIEKKDTIFEGVKVELVPFKDIFIPDNADDWEKTPVIRKVYPTYGELKTNENKKKGYIQDNIGKWLLKDEGEKTLTEGEQSEDQILSDVQVTHKEVIECIECYVNYVYQKDEQDKEDITNWDEERLIAQIAVNSKVIIRLIPLRDVNFKNQHLVKRIALFRRQGKSCGTPLHSKLRSIQKGASKTFNMAINIAEVVLVPWYLYTDKAGFRGEKTKLKPGMGILVDDIQSVLFPRFNINPSQMFQYIEVWMNFWERVVSIGNLQIGLPDSKKTTATQTLAVIQEGNVKHNYQSKPVRKDFIALLRTIYDLYYQNMPLEKTFFYNNEDVQIPRSDMARPYKFRLTGSTELSNKLIERKEKEDLYTMAANDPFGVLDPVKIWEDILLAYNKTNTKEMINPELNQIAKIMKEVPESKEIFAQAAEQAMALAQGGKQQ